MTDIFQTLDSIPSKASLKVSLTKMISRYNEMKSFDRRGGGVLGGGPLIFSHSSVL